MIDWRMTARIFAIVALTSMVLSVLDPVKAEDKAKMFERTVSVSATGSVTADPDLAAISTGVQTEGDTARDALSRNNVAMTKLIDGLKTLGLSAKDIQTSGLNVSPRYQNYRDGRPPTINGYQAVNQVRIVVRDIKRIGEVLDQTVTLGANQMGGISFDVSTAEVLRDEARKVAMANALRRARLYAAAAGAEVGPVLSIAEDVRVAGPHPMVMGRAAMTADASVPVEPGSQRLEAVVHVTYALK